MRLACLFALLLTLLGSAAFGNAMPVVVVLVPGTSLTDWQTAPSPHLKMLLKTGALALMNMRSARPADPRGHETLEGTLLTLSAGSRAWGDAADTQFLAAGALAPGTDVTVAEMMRRRCGESIAPDVLADLDWPRLQRENTGRGYDIRLGNLADALQHAGVNIFAAGSTGSELVALGGDGTIRQTTLSAFLQRKTPGVLIESATIDGADDAIADGAEGGKADNAGNASRTNFDSVLAAAMTGVAARRGTLIVLSPYVGTETGHVADRLALTVQAGAGQVTNRLAPSAQMRAGQMADRLAPVLFWGPNVPVGLIASPSTRHAGLIANTDFAPTVAALFGAKLPESAFGRAVTFQPNTNAQLVISRIDRQSLAQRKAMRILPYLAILMGFWSGGVTLLRARRRSIPPVLCLMPALLVFSLLVSSSAIRVPGVFALGLITALVWRARPWRILLLLGTLTIIVLTVDMCRHDPWMQRSLLGYSAIEGARYYGIGNEATGALIGALIVTLCLLKERLSRRFWGVLLLGLFAVSVLIGLPSAGAKAGGLIISVAVLITLAFEFYELRWSAARFGGVFGAVLGAMALAALADAHHLFGAQSHYGQAMGRIAGQGWGEAVDIIGRKLAVEGRLAYHSAWAVFLWAALGGWIWSITRRSSGVSRAEKAAGAVGVFACLLFNDAGVVSAALCIAWLWSSAMLRATNAPYTQANAPHREKNPLRGASAD